MASSGISQPITHYSDLLKKSLLDFREAGPLELSFWTSKRLLTGSGATNRVPAPQHLPTNGVHITRPTEVNFSSNSEKFAAKTVPVTTPPCDLR
ncbi:hypothetical protein TNCV_1137151 [Trichonephila clavipes]|nr:hypothetical protein TNCV_1137151 [Trichonephila clavipes]